MVAGEHRFLIQNFRDLSQSQGIVLCDSILQLSPHFRRKNSHLIFLLTSAMMLDEADEHRELRSFGILRVLVDQISHASENETKEIASVFEQRGVKVEIVESIGLLEQAHRRGRHEGSSSCSIFFRELCVDAIKFLQFMDRVAARNDKRFQEVIDFPADIQICVRCLTGTLRLGGLFVIFGLFWDD
ncbi:hypothetical protein HYR82_02140 [Candidatus Peregrinibacteria bacterium]|nr:hypothetical protein [Candidatus Peregrinibacteria bacterium]